MSIGVMPQSASLSKLPGSEPHSVALTNDGRIGNGSSFTPCGTAYSANDVIGCCVNFSDNVILFTKNGHQAGEHVCKLSLVPVSHTHARTHTRTHALLVHSRIAAEIAVGRAMLHDKSLYPAIGLSSPRREVHVNFGQEPFVFNFEHHKTVRACNPMCVWRGERRVCVCVCVDSSLSHPHVTKHLQQHGLFLLTLLNY